MWVNHNFRYFADYYKKKIFMSHKWSFKDLQICYFIWLPKIPTKRESYTNIPCRVIFHIAFDTQRFLSTFSLTLFIDFYYPPTILTLFLKCRPVFCVLPLLFVPFFAFAWILFCSDPNFHIDPAWDPSLRIQQQQRQHRSPTAAVGHLTDHCHPRPMTMIRLAIVRW